jgi:hypothetical protein
MTWFSAHRWIGWLWAGWLAVALIGLPADEAAAQRRRPAAKKAQPKLPDLKTHADKLKLLEIIRHQMPTTRPSRTPSFTPEDFDKLLQQQIGLPGEKFAPIISDEAFLRRASLDLTGKPPTPSQIEAFVASGDRNKRAKLIDELLDSEDYGKKWGRYWQNAIFFNSTANRRSIDREGFENWLAEQFNNNVTWDRIVAEMVSATPKRGSERYDYGQDHAPNNFVLANRNDANDIASETARLFMGVSIQCAECHDHPFDQWKREQYWQLSAFFARGSRFYMPDEHDPSERSVVKAKFLLGETPHESLKPDHLRVAVAAYLVYNPKNYWFARAYVNRMWSELVGDGFYAVDSLGPDQEVVHQVVVNRLAAVFRYKDFDHKWVFRTIMNTQAYQRESRTLGSHSELFTAVRPARMRPDQVIATVANVTGTTNANLDRQLTNTFDVDPSIPQESLEGTIQQALLLMNNGTLNNQLKSSALKKELVALKDDRALVDRLYKTVLARSPSDSEVRRSLGYLKEVKNRSEAVDDLMWVLVNSTEFITKR